MNLILLPNATPIITDLRQIKHIRSVLKAQVGATVKIGIRNGKIGCATIVHISAKHIELSNMRLTIDPPSKSGLTVVLALPRPLVLRRLILDMTAFGVAQIVLLNSQRTEKSYWQSSAMEKLPQFIDEGLEQGIDTAPPKLVLAKSFSQFVQQILPALPAPLMLAHPYEAMPIAQYTARPQTLIIGAEGGFLPWEVEQLRQAGAVAVSLGGRILRTESVVSALLGRLL